jgi:cyclophilin family peptidyl-prolyl cis-trans isomerase
MKQPASTLPKFIPFSLFAALVFGLLLSPTPTTSAQSSTELGPDVVVLEIQLGRSRERERVVIGLYDFAAPQTTANFKELVQRRFYNNMRFHRLFPNTLVQTGDPRSRRGQRELSGTGGPGYTLPAEIRLPHETGSLSMARLPDRINPSKASNGSQFFVCLQPMPALNGQYTVFGRVLEGMEVLTRISNTRTDSNDFPIEKIVIRRATLEPRLTLAPPSA